MIHTCTREEWDARLLVVPMKPAWGDPHPDGLDGTLTARPLIRVIPAEWRALTEPCETCDGHGIITNLGDDGPIELRWRTMTCPDCAGSGRSILTVRVPCGHEQYDCDCYGGQPHCKQGCILERRVHVDELVPVFGRDDRPTCHPFIQQRPGGNGYILHQTEHGKAVRSNAALPPNAGPGDTIALVSEVET